MTKPMVVSALMEALVSGSDASRDRDEMGTRWGQDGAASIPAAMGMLAYQALDSASDLMALTFPSVTMTLRQNLGSL